MKSFLKILSLISLLWILAMSAALWIFKEEISGFLYYSILIVFNLIFLSLFLESLVLFLSKNSKNSVSKRLNPIWKCLLWVSFKLGSLGLLIWSLNRADDYSKWAVFFGLLTYFFVPLASGIAWNFKVTRTKG